MCGILGIKYFSNKKVNLEEFKSALALLHRRGPDQQGIWVDEKRDLALGNARLAIVGGKKRGIQPMQLRETREVITYNGEIYNYLRIAKDLGQKIQTRTDTETILKGFRSTGKEILALLEGMFAFSIWDPGKRELFLARDKFGIKPLYYYLDQEKFIFSSEISPILRFSNIDKEVDTTALYDYFTYLYIPTPKTPYKKIKKLPPASYLICNEGKLKIEEYWDLDFKNKIETESKKTIESVNNLLEESISSIIPPSERFGLLLSGGLDSSTLLSYLNNKDNLLGTFSIGFDVKQHSELNFAKMVSRYFLVKNFSEVVDYQTAVKVFPSLMELLEEPLGNCSVIPTYRLFNLCRRENLRILISGEGGDEIFGGYNWYSWFQEKEARQLPGRWSIEEQIETYIELLGGFTKRRKKAIFKKEIIENFEAYDDYWFFRKYWDINLDSFSKLQRVDVKTYLPDDLLFKGDRISANFSQEVRFPFLNSSLASFLASLPDSIKNPNMERKYLLKQIASKRVPKEIIDRKKKGFSIPFYVWMENGLVKTNDTRNSEFGDFRNFYNCSANSLEKYFLLSFLEWNRKWIK